ncbi:MAG: hypothetical protein R6W78_12130 [Bacteroidales bacterium]
MIYAIALGIVTEIIIRYIIRYFRDDDILLGLLLGTLFTISDIAFIFGFSHLLPIMLFAFYVENFSGSSLPRKFHNSINSIEKPILGVFSAGFAIGLILEAQNRLNDFIPEMASLMLSVVL